MATLYAVVDAARDYVRIGVCRTVSASTTCLFIGEKGHRLEHVAPHLCECDSAGVIEHLVVSGQKPDEVGILAETHGDFRSTFRHFRRFLTVVRERDNQRVLFRFYDPRILRAFLPACNKHELSQFFGPIKKFHCQGDDPGLVSTFTLGDDATLFQEDSTFQDFFKLRYGVDPDTVQPIPKPPPPPPEHPHAKLIRRLHFGNF